MRLPQGGAKSGFVHVAKDGEAGVEAGAPAPVDESGAKLFHVKGSSEDCCKAIQVRYPVLSLLRI